MKPRVFIGSSRESLEVAESIQENLEYTAETTVWSQALELSAPVLGQLLEILGQTDFGIFVFTPDDLAKIRRKRYQVAGDNVVFELGLCLAKLGKKRTFISITP